MNISARIIRLYSHCRLPAACIMGMAALALLWAGLELPDLMPKPSVAMAEETSGEGVSGATPLERDRALLLQSSVDTAALSLGSALVDASTETKRDMLAAALSELTFRLGGEVYFTAWQGTRIIHAPLTPDADTMDFADALDARGTAFVLHMSDLAAEGGGFLRVTLPRQLADGMLDNGAVPPAGAVPARAATVRGEVKLVSEPEASEIFFALDPACCPLGTGRAADEACAAVVMLPLAGMTPPPGGEAVNQTVYVREIPRSGWHIAAFMPLDSVRARTEPFSSAWVVTQNAAQARIEGVFRKGLCFSGLSLAGLAGLMLVPGRGRKNG